MSCCEELCKLQSPGPVSSPAAIIGIDNIIVVTIIGIIIIVIIVIDNIIIVTLAMSKLV